MKWDTLIALSTLYKKSSNGVTVYSKKSIRSLGPADLSGKKVLVRVDFNVPLHDGKITDDSRIKANLPTLHYLLENNATVILMSHLGRPNGQATSELSLAPVATRLSKLLDQPVTMAPGCIGPDIKKIIQESKSQDVILLENVRFHPEETRNEDAFAKQLASLGDLFVQDSFGTVHRNHASTAGIAQYLPSYAGLLLDTELTILNQSIIDPKRPFMAIIGGAKVSSKLQVLDSLLNTVDTLIIGGGMVYTFLKANGIEIGKSLYEEDQLTAAISFLENAKTSKTKVLFPVDHCTVPELSADAPLQIVSNIPKDQMGVDIGPKTINAIQLELRLAKTILWNGPLGIFEIPEFATGTMAISETLAQSSAITIVGGGDSAAAIKKSGLSDQITHISTGGGASLAFLSNRALPGITILEDQD
jgi:phosphoglycerate kinase